MDLGFRVFGLGFSGFRGCLGRGRNGRARPLITNRTTTTIGCPCTNRICSKMAELVVVRQHGPALAEGSGLWALHDGFGFLGFGGLGFRV